MSETSTQEATGQEPPVKDGSEQVIRIPFFQLKPSPTNPRKTIDPKADGELAKSIKEKDVQVPLLVRPIEGFAKYEVVVGSRRFRCAQKADLDDVPCIIREMTDEEAREIQIIENLQRADVLPLDEALGLKALAENMKVEAIATHIGKSASYVYQRLKLCDLTPEAQKLMASGRLPAGHAVMIARLQPTGQKLALEMCFPAWQREAPALSVRQLASALNERAVYDTTKAPFSLEDAELDPAAGPCTTCPKLAKNNPALKGLDPNACTDQPCYEGKVNAEIDRRVKAAQAEGKPLVRIHAVYSGKKAPQGAHDLQNGQYRWAGKNGNTDYKSCPTQEAAIIVDGREIGKLFTICADQECRTHWPNQSTKNRKTDQAADKRRRAIENRALGYALDAMIGKTEKLDERSVITAIYESTYEELGYQLEPHDIDEMRGKIIDEIRPILKHEKKLKDAPVATLVKAILALIELARGGLHLHPEKWRKQAALEIKAEEAKNHLGVGVLLHGEKFVLGKQHLRLEPSGKRKAANPKPPKVKLAKKQKPKP